MVSIRSNLNSVASTYDSLTALKKRIITTCLKHWRRKFVQKYCRKESAEKQHQHSFKEYSFSSWKVKNIFGTVKDTSNNNKSNKSGETVEFVARLLSSTLITTTTKTTTTTVPNCVYSEANSSSMTITNDTFLQVRYEHPDLDAEVRSILLARAQEGATIGDIKEEYLKNTGMPFPVYNNITDFLLSIPNVSALCNAQGTRIFSIVPTEKTKHLYDLILNQKPTVQPRMSYDSDGSRRMPTYPPVQRNKIHWRQRIINQQTRFDCNNVYNNNNFPFETACQQVQQSLPVPQPMQQIQQQPQPMQQIQQQPQLTEQLLKQHPTAQLVTYPENLDDGTVSQSDSVVCIDNNNYYRDNCNHLYNRLCNQPVLPTLAVMPAQHAVVNHESNLNRASSSYFNNNNFNSKTLAHFNHFNHYNHFQDHPYQLPQSQDNRSSTYAYGNRRKSNVKSFYQPPKSRCSSPAATRSSQCNESGFTSDSDYGAHLLDFALLGDDFFLFLARMELRCKFNKDEKVLQSGLCISGQSIRGAIKRIQKLNDGDKSIIINIGSVDIMQGKPLVQIQHDFRELVNETRRKGFTPILTTLAPLANYGHQEEMKQNLERFNKFIKRIGKGLVVIDIYLCLVNERNNILFDCYQSEPRTVSGTVEPYVFWNKIGRQRVLKLIESKLEY